jgi:dissimilatory sulfite reductase (desulfoviridin) alpha/beta subunit
MPKDLLKSPFIIPQRQEDYYLIRIRSLAGDFKAQELGVIGRVAEKYGKACGDSIDYTGSFCDKKLVQGGRFLVHFCV